MRYYFALAEVGTIRQFDPRRQGSVSGAAERHRYLPGRQFFELGKPNVSSIYVAVFFKRSRNLPGDAGSRQMR